MDYEITRYYDNWKKTFEKYKVVVDQPKLSLGEYSMIAQSVFYSMIRLIAQITECKMEKVEEGILRELNDCAVSIRIHILCFRKILPDPDSLETLDYINALYKRIPMNKSSDEELEKYYEKTVRNMEKMKMM